MNKASLRLNQSELTSTITVSHQSTTSDYSNNISNLNIFFVKLELCGNQCTEKPTSITISVSVKQEMLVLQYCAIVENNAGSGIILVTKPQHGKPPT